VTVFFDTNILIYSISVDAAEAAKKERAVALLEREDGGLSIQVLQEFYAQATRATRPHRLPHDIAVGLIRAWTRFQIQPLTLAVLDAALEIRTRHRFSYWDCAVIAAARALGCNELYTEDLSHGRDVDGTLIINPFR
jgi:predicted nucleic acid-binding protein